jgi:hypothetical protein
MKTINSILNGILVWALLSILLMLAAPFCTGCAAVPPQVAMRRSLSGKLTTCLREANGNELWRKQCIRESVVYCREHKLEASCAYDELITNLPGERP